MQVTDVNELYFELMEGESMKLHNDNNLFLAVYGGFDLSG
jgi:hypothetical protein